MITENSVVVVTKSQVSCELDGEEVILNLGDGVYYGLNRVGAHIWNLISEPREVSDIRDILLKTYPVSHERCMCELLALLEELATRGLIEVQYVAQNA